jgi:shikimate dehydrogenase
MTTLPGRLVLLGHPVSHSLSPVFQNAALAAAGIDLTYEAVDTPPGLLQVTLDDVKRERWAGNVTVPHKEAVFARCRELTPLARRVGAVNAFLGAGDGIVGHNTDVEGVRAAVRHLVGRNPSDWTIGVIGAGGAAAAVLAAVEGWHNCRAIVANRNAARRDALVERFGSIARSGDVEEIAGRANLVVNATTLGLHADDPLPVDPARLANDAAVLDLVYSLEGTPLVRVAAANGRRATDGLRMLVEQGAAAFEWWFGRPADRDVMWASLDRFKSSRSR